VVKLVYNLNTTQQNSSLGDLSDLSGEVEIKLPMLTSSWHFSSSRFVEKVLSQMHTKIDRIDGFTIFQEMVKIQPS
jgi:hypothetical protein